MACRVLFHPRLLASRADEIARSQRGRIRWDASGRPFVPAADPLTPPPGGTQGGLAPAEAPADPMRFAWLIRALRALTRQATSPDESPGRFHSRPVPR